MTWKILSFGGVTLPTVLTTVPVGAAPVATVGAQLPGGAYFDQDGAGEHAQPRFPIPFPWRGTILAADRAAVETTLMALTTLSGLRANTLIRQLQNGSVQQWCTARLLSVPALAAVTNVRTLPVELQFQLLSHWFTAAPITNTAALTADNTTSVTLVNAGNARVTDCVITVTAGNAAITSVTITRAGYSEMVYTGTIQAGMSLVIDTGAWSVLNDGVNAYTSAFQFTANHHENTWLRIPRSVPSGVAFTVALLGGGASPTARFYYYEAWQ